MTGIPSGIPYVPMRPRVLIRAALTVRPLFLAVALGGCAIRTPDLPGGFASMHEPFPVESLPGTDRPPAPWVAAALRGTDAPVLRDEETGRFEFPGRSGDEGVCEYRGASRGAVFWRSGSAGPPVEHLLVWQPDTTAIYIDRMLTAALPAAQVTITEKSGDAAPIAGGPAEPEPGEASGGASGGEATTEKGADLPYWSASINIHRSTAAGPTRGAVYFASSLGGPTGAERQSMRGLQKRGWHVIEIQCPRRATPKYLRTWFDARRPRPVKAKAKTARGGGETPSVPEHEAKEISDDLFIRWETATTACIVDVHLMTSVVAALAVDEHVSAALPDVVGKPRVLLGVSYGALAAPSIAAATAVPFDCVVLVAGGANLAMASDRVGLRRYARGLVAVDWKPRSGNGAKDPELSRKVFLEVCRLDPYHWAPALADTPVLQIQAMYDAIVPTRSGEILYEQLGRPERWEYPTGHIGLFWFVGLAAEATADWIDRALMQRAATIAAQPGPADPPPPPDDPARPAPTVSRSRAAPRFGSARRRGETRRSPVPATAARPTP